MGKRLAGLALGLVLLSAGSVPVVARQAIGIFTGSGDIGTPSTIGPGSAVYDAGKNIHTLSGGGENMWVTSSAAGNRATSVNWSGGARTSASPPSSDSGWDIVRGR